jgi:small-conductance mechanosensitive channel
MAISVNRSGSAEHRRSTTAGAAAHAAAEFPNILFVVVIAVAALMALAEMGVEIGPLIAGLGVLGIAVGFGAQTFVRDVIAGMFHLLDDAFRVGEYIQAGNYKGTVEGFSIR